MTRRMTDAAMVSKEIRKELKVIGIKARVHSKTYSGGDSVHIYTTDLSPEQERKVSDICNKYQMGHFDGMVDCYEYSNFNKDLVAQVKYVFVKNCPSDEMIENILKSLDEKDIHKQFDTDEKIKEFFNDYNMSRTNLARRIFRGRYPDVKAFHFWGQPQTV